MKFLCDVHISIQFVKHLNNMGFECVHDDTILDKWFTTDGAIATCSDSKNFVLIAKDLDFKNSFLINKTPRRLIKINLGNISNTLLFELFDRFVSEIEMVNNNLNQFMIEMDINFLKVTTNLSEEPKISLN